MDSTDHDFLGSSYDPDRLCASRRQFYTARFFLGLAEASFFPGMIVYLTHWFCSRDRGRAMACLYIAVPTASLIGSPLAGGYWEFIGGLLPDGVGFLSWRVFPQLSWES